MKKIVIASFLALAALSASAIEVGVSAAQDRALDETGVRLTAGAAALPLGFKGSWEATRIDAGSKQLTQYGVAATREITKLGVISVGAKVGASYIDRNFGQDGYAATVGLGATMPLTQKLDLNVGAERRYGQDRIADLNGNTLTAGLSYKF